MDTHISQTAPLTHREFGRRIGVSESMASRLRRGHRLPSVRTVRRIQREFGIPYDELHRACELGGPAFGQLLDRYTDRA